MEPGLRLRRAHPALFEQNAMRCSAFSGTKNVCWLFNSGRTEATTDGRTLRAPPSPFSRHIMNVHVADRAISIYEALADRSEPRGARQKLARHLDTLYNNGERDPHRLTVHGLSFLRELDQQQSS
jgi:hypothetical protein